MNKTPYKYGYGLGSGGNGIVSAITTKFDGFDSFQKATDLSGNADSKVALIAFRLKRESSGSVFIYNTDEIGFDGGQLITIDNNDRLNFQFFNSAGASRAFVTTAIGDLTNDGICHSIICQIDTANGDGVVYVDDVDLTATSTIIDDTLDWTRTKHTIGADFNQGSDFIGNMEIFYLHNSATFDISIEANRRKIFNSDGSVAIDPASNASSVQGTAPIMFFSTNNNFSTFNVNQGSDTTSFTITGALEQGAVC